MATIQDVAKRAGVSVATVSRVLNHSLSVREDTRKKVQVAIKDLNYQPNLLGRNLRRSETKMILVLLPTISNTFYVKIVKGIEEVGLRNGYNIMLCDTDSDKQREEVYLDLLKNKLIDGAIFMATELSKEELSEIGRYFPMIQCCEYKEGAEVSYISIDNFAAAYKAVQHLIELGHQRIGMISGTNHCISTFQREAGYKKALEDAGIAFDDALILKGEYGFKSGFRAAKQFLHRDKRPTAIFAMSDMMAIGAMKAIKERGLQIPDDMAVVGFDNIRFSTMVEPQLTTISQPQYDIGCIAMDLLLKQMKGELKEPQHIFVEHELIIRKSTFK
ncbi:MAG: LacI family DNA-binding transcriptional regulator [Firmicutes bacterium]|nr:LacI family DNA-binding transcriptional regulator [Bacillota bacterium]